MATLRLQGRGSLLAVSALVLVTSACAHQSVQGPAPTKISSPVAADSYGGSPRVVKDAVRGPALNPSPLSLHQIERYLKSRSSKLKSPREGVWHISIEGVMILTIVDTDRVRIMAPIFALQQLKGAPKTRSALMVRLLQANFDDTADARYAIFNGIVFAAVMQPRDSVSAEKALGEYLTQVVNLHKNTFRVGDSAYSSVTPDPNSVEIDPRADKSLPFLEEEGPEVEVPAPADETPPEVKDERVFL